MPFSKSDGTILLSIGSWNAFSGQEWSSQSCIVWIVYYTFEDNDQYSCYYWTSGPCAMTGSWRSGWFYVCAESKPQPAIGAMWMQASVAWRWPSTCLMGFQQWGHPLGSNATVRQFQFRWVTKWPENLRVGPWTSVGHWGPALGRRRVMRQLCSQAFHRF